MAAKTTCPVTREQFKQNAKPIEVIIDGQKMIAEAREFSTGSLGWNISKKMTIMVGDIQTTVQIGMNLTIVGSKELPKESPA
jgi:hypothetical protein